MMYASTVIFLKLGTPNIITVAVLNYNSLISSCCSVLAHYDQSMYSFNWVSLIADDTRIAEIEFTSLSTIFMSYRDDG